MSLTRRDTTRFEIRRLARKRFILGYPPRKPNDTSIGDPINWEWIIHCAKDKNKNVVIVSRDSDYGYRYGNEPIINDWLSQEFRERVRRRKKVILTNRLMNAFELASVTVKEEEIKAEEKLIDEMTATASIPTFAPGTLGALLYGHFKAREQVDEYLKAVSNLQKFTRQEFETESEKKEGDED